MGKTHLTMSEDDKIKYNEISEKLERILIAADKLIRDELKEIEFESTAKLHKYYGTSLFVVEITYNFESETHITYSVIIGNDVNMVRFAKEIARMAIRYFNISVAPIAS